MNSVRYSSICGFFSLSIILLISTRRNYHCHAFTQPTLHHVVQTTRSIQLLGQPQQGNAAMNNRRNRFWGHSGNNHPSQQRRIVATVVVSVISGPSILDRPSTTTEESSTVKEGRRQRQQQKEEELVDDKQQRYNETWEVRLYNDGLNTREHVSRSLVQVTGLSEYQAYQTMMQAHHNGMAVVGQYYYEIAEMFHDALKLEGIICDIVPVE